jgi:hypothetical protein
MPLGAIAEVVVVLHVGFFAFVALGGLLAGRARSVIWFHLPALAWAGLMIGVGSECPLTALEKWLRSAAGQEPYAGGFVDHYIEDVVYPDELTPVLWSLAATVVVASYARLVMVSRARVSVGANG